MGVIGCCGRLFFSRFIFSKLKNTLFVNDAVMNECDYLEINFNKWMPKIYFIYVFFINGLSKYNNSQ